MIKILWVAFNQNETCYYVKYKAFLNVLIKVSVFCGSHTNQRPRRGSPRHARDGRAAWPPLRPLASLEALMRHGKTAAAQGRKHRTRLDCRHRTNTRLEKRNSSRPRPRTGAARAARAAHTQRPAKPPRKARKQRSRNGNRDRTARGATHARATSSPRSGGLARSLGLQKPGLRG